MGKFFKEPPLDELDHLCDDHCLLQAMPMTPIPVSLPSSRTMFIVGEVSDATLAAFAPYFFELDKGDGEITIKLSSPGGDVSAGTAIYDMIKQSKNKVAIHGYGMVSSVATLILQGADTRLLSENSGLMVHQVSTLPADIPAKSSDLRIQSEEIARLNELYYGIMAKRSGLSKAEVKKLCEQDTYMTAKKAVSLGLADGILK